MYLLVTSFFIAKRMVTQGRNRDRSQSRQVAIATGCNCKAEGRRMENRPHGTRGKRQI